MLAREEIRLLSLCCHCQGFILRSDRNFHCHFYAVCQGFSFSSARAYYRCRLYDSPCRLTTQQVSGRLCEYSLVSRIGLRSDSPCQRTPAPILEQYMCHTHTTQPTASSILHIVYELYYILPIDTHSIFPITLCHAVYF